MLKRSVIRITGLATALFVALVMSASGALAMRPRDPDVGGTGAPNVVKAGHLSAGTAASTPAPSSGFEVFGQTWQLALAVVVASIAVVALAAIATRRHHLAQA